MSFEPPHRLVSRTPRTAPRHYPRPSLGSGGAERSQRPQPGVHPGLDTSPSPRRERLEPLRAGLAISFRGLEIRELSPARAASVRSKARCFCGPVGGGVTLVGAELGHDRRASFTFHSARDPLETKRRCDTNTTVRSLGTRKRIYQIVLQLAATTTGEYSNSR